MDSRLAALQSRLGHRFAEEALLERALRHRSYGADHNERLEFLGDAVLSLAISSLLFERFAGSDEGDLTRVRAHLVREDSLHKVALSLGLPEVLRLSVQHRVNMRTAAYMTSISRVAAVHKLRGIYA